MLVTAGGETVGSVLNNHFITLLTGDYGLQLLDLTSDDFFFVKSDGVTPSDYESFDKAVEVGTEIRIQLMDSQGRKTAGTIIHAVDADSLR
ncbi:hypothetical protein BRE01_66100 [Brevibacillus reuszeri]|uniref:Uncharacterized protein n=1 Tax=Brevibacillus reuszeri TaxID=54915 RepID=A0A0K9YUD4_9BACL|nr:hypothetical protein [Brevibacillus reuszeri]KNB72324.1 hypothetical protein ADS79_10545 [Brevibacillus reuszeri]MED1861029.1 hypothetical protein [Brevibacillus reuszeri]GED72908.1 hypothetical protein BRE01_66100 [Brevibacillus reuszeri]